MSAQHAFKVFNTETGEYLPDSEAKDYYIAGNGKLRLFVPYLNAGKYGKYAVPDHYIPHFPADIRRKEMELRDRTNASLEPFVAELDRLMMADPTADIDWVKVKEQSDDYLKARVESMDAENKRIYEEVIPANPELASPSLDELKARAQDVADRFNKKYGLSHGNIGTMFGLDVWDNAQVEVDDDPKGMYQVYVRILGANVGAKMWHYIYCADTDSFIDRFQGCLDH
jgi:hypothetical protein